ncbi:MAG: hypothetical protein A2Z88_03480 [Omnitrophica WOR_2 bacterium GWA2_47_8]|nr:MAG: hypothetical protein A2Z88_03480 [Omnitrophica WOR_2 bacterium GWA2_47_8]
MNTKSVVENLEECFANYQEGEIYRLAIGKTEQFLIEKALEKTSGNQITAARILGINRNTLRAKIRKFKIDHGRFKG